MRRTINTAVSMAMVFGICALTNLYASVTAVHGSGMAKLKNNDVKISMVLTKDDALLNGFFRFEPINIDIGDMGKTYPIISLYKPESILIEDSRIFIKGKGSVVKSPASIEITLTKSNTTCLSYDVIDIKASAVNGQDYTYNASVTEGSISVTKELTLQNAVGGELWFLLNKSFSSHLNLNVMSAIVEGKTVFIGSISLREENFMGTVDGYFFESRSVTSLKVQKDKITIKGVGLYKGETCDYSLKIKIIKPKTADEPIRYSYELTTSDGGKYSNSSEELHGDLIIK